QPRCIMADRTTTGKASHEAERRNSKPITLVELARDKALPVEFLASLGLTDSRQGVQIPYYDVTGELIATKLRTALQAQAGSRWPAGKPTVCYGQWRISDMQKAGLLLLVEGESDCWALWHQGWPALGVPGANTTAKIEAEHLEGVELLYVSREPDQGGERFA